MTRQFRVTKYEKKDKSSHMTRDCDKNSQKDLQKLKEKIEYRQYKESASMQTTAGKSPADPIGQRHGRTSAAAETAA